MVKHLLRSLSKHSVTTQINSPVRELFARCHCFCKCNGHQKQCHQPDVHSGWCMMMCLQTNYDDLLARTLQPPAKRGTSWWHITCVINRLPNDPVRVSRDSIVSFQLLYFFVPQQQPVR